mmetsp:Transcript_16630/g.41676  ORF Transcript_16630/g.41676 Transcript_16630/m.41676 type:complete len:189 (+) Transcript_16630:863-1429(+)
MKNIVRQTNPTRRNGRDDKSWSSLLIDIDMGDDNDDCYVDDSKQLISSCWPHIPVPEPFPRWRIAMGLIATFATLYDLAQLWKLLEVWKLLEESESKQTIGSFLIALFFLQTIAYFVAFWGVLLQKKRMALSGMVIAFCCVLCIGLQEPICNVIQSQECPTVKLMPGSIIFYCFNCCVLFLYFRMRLR